MLLNLLYCRFQYILTYFIHSPSFFLPFLCLSVCQSVCLSVSPPSLSFSSLVIYTHAHQKLTEKENETDMLMMDLHLRLLYYSHWFPDSTFLTEMVRRFNCRKKTVIVCLINDGYVLVHTYCGLLWKTPTFLFFYFSLILILFLSYEHENRLVDTSIFVLHKQAWCHECCGA